MVGEIIAVAMFAAAILAVMWGYPVAFTLAGVGLWFSVVGHLFGVFDFSILHALPSRYFGIMMNEVLVAVPLFVFMGVMLERSKIAEDLLKTMGELFGTLRGGLGFSVVIVGALLAASTGIVGATVVTMGLLSLPAMQRAGYDPKLASGVICASGTLGQIIPPSTVLIFMGDILQGANQRAQLEMGNFAPEPLSVGQLFAGAMIPGLILVGLYMAWVLFKAITDPESCPALEKPPGEQSRLLVRIFTSLVPPLALIIAVLGSILTGLATPTESASVGAVGAILLALFLGLVRKRPVNLQMMNEVMRATLKISCMIFVILLGASVFSVVFRGLGGEELVFDVLAAMPGEQLGALIAVMLLMFFLGFFLDTFEIIFIVVPITAPVLIKLGINPIWLGVMMGVNLQTSFLTPPFGFALFYLRGVAGKVLTTVQIYRGVLPFIGLQAVAMALLWFFPGTATYLPRVLFDSPVRERQIIPISPEGSDPSTRQFDNLFGPPPSSSPPSSQPSGSPQSGQGERGGGSSGQNLNGLFGP